MGASSPPQDQTDRSITLTDARRALERDDLTSAERRALETLVADMEQDDGVLRVFHRGDRPLRPQLSSRDDFDVCRRAVTRSTRRPILVRTLARPRGAGRPRAQAARSSARSGDSGDDDGPSDDEVAPAPAVETRS